MTAIVGMICKDGIVIASESQESDEIVGMKRLDAIKVYDTKRFNFEDIEIIVAGTGSVGHIARAAEIIEEKGFAPRFTTPRTVADIVEDTMGTMTSRYGDLDLELMVGVYCKNCPKQGEPPPSPIALFTVYPPEEGQRIGLAEPVVDYTAIGTGGLFARYLLNRLHDDEHPTARLSIDEAIKEAIYVIEEVKKVDLWCGGPTQLVYIAKEGEEYTLKRKRPSDIRTVASDLARADESAKTTQREIFSSSHGAKKH
jgi:20S proteasome alpha/beta subunit